MKVLVVGGGGREHALCWKIAQSPLVDEIYCAPGNPGIAALAIRVELAANDVPGLVAFAKDKRIDLTVVGPEEPLCLGLADQLRAARLKVFGPDQAGARVEGDKAFARDLCRRNRIPSPGYWVFDATAPAYAFLENRPDGPIVVKAAGLAAGKGVVVCANRAAAREALRQSIDVGVFGRAGKTVVLEEFLEGPEVSMILLTDGHTVVPLEPARDHKRVFDDDEGPNTGGMGAISPVATLGPRLKRQIEDQVLLPAVHGLNRESITYRGFLYAGLMLTANGPRVLEFNCRLGDPEAQPLLMRMKSDLVPFMLHTVDGTLDRCEAPDWDPRTAVCVVATSPGYPGDYEKRIPIHGVETVAMGDDLQVFHAGTAVRNGELVTDGGRVLSVCALGDSLESARERAYGAVQRIEFRGKHVRTDIGSR